MTKTLRLLALAAVVALSSWTANVEATEATPEITVYQASQDLANHQVNYSGGLAPFFASENADELTCREQLDQCSAACDPADQYCFQDCQCQFWNCKGYQCN